MKTKRLKMILSVMAIGMLMTGCGEKKGSCQSGEIRKQVQRKWLNKHIRI